MSKHLKVNRINNSNKKSPSCMAGAILFLLLMLLWGFIGGFSLKPLEIAAEEENINLQGLGYKILALVLPLQNLSESSNINSSDMFNSLVVSFLPFKANVAFASDMFLSEKQEKQEVMAILPDKKGLVFLNEYKEKGKLDKDKPLVGVYSSHSAETYVPYAGAAKLAGKHGGVYEASETVIKALKQYNIAALIDETIHDYPDWSKSYSNSLKTASRLMQDNPSIRVLIDMHRDAGLTKKMTTCTVNGKCAARIMLVVGSNKRSNHPNWEVNKSFAEEIGKTMEEMYPGLLRAVKVQDGRYNQHVFTGAILVEMGSTENTIEEVKYSSVLLADVLAKILLKP
ncbi:MAG: stage II sporulation protein P [Clostridia bacterium]|nr:stage II sporulation protein P [Clostridia bacterium]